MRALLVLLSLFTAQAFASEIECERQINETQYTYAKIEVWPDFLAQVGTRSCVGKDLKVCYERADENVIDYDRVCGYRMNVRWACQIREWTDAKRNHIVQTHCPRAGVTATLVVQPNRQGTLSCYTGSHLDYRFRLGTCRGGR